MSARALKAAGSNQRAAADPETSVFVTANAGSGKTKVLVDRIARLLLAGAKPSAFLCVTYTKAAASEMQRRLFERLGGWCVADDASLAADLMQLGAGDADLGKARALFARALETPGGLKIQTIHAFCERLLARFPLEAGVPPGFDIADEARAAALLSEARADAALAPDAPRAAFERFAARLSGDALQDLLDRFASRRAEFHRYAVRHKGNVFVEAELRNRHGVRSTSDQLCRGFVVRQDWESLREACAALAESSSKDQAAAARLKSALDAFARQADVRVIAEACIGFALNDKGEPYKAFVTKSLGKAKPWLEPRLERFADSAAALASDLNAIERADDAAAAMQLALRLDRAYQLAKARSGVLDFDDLIEGAQALLQRSAAAAWVLYKLDGGLDHILIDEGQDTSPGQWDIIAPLQEEFFAGRGARENARTVFAVGDPKQSIYAFQGADPARFLDEARRLDKRARKAGVRFKAPILETSFRSGPEVLRVVDAVFADKKLIATEPDAHDIPRHLAFRDREAAVVEVWPLALRPVVQPATPWDAPMDRDSGASVHAQLARAIAKRVSAMIAAREAVWEKGALRPVRAGDVLALVRTRGALFRELIKAFKREKLPVAGADRMVLRDELAVEDCLALMRVALDPQDDLALACVLKGPWCNLDDDNVHLFPLAYGRAKGETLYARLMATQDALYAAAKAFVSDVVARRGESAFGFLSWALEAPHGGGDSGWMRLLARLGPEARDPLEELLQRALKPAAHTAPTLQRFLSEIERDAGEVKRELEAETGAVRVMTVHGAKGLEAPVVILPDTTAPPNDKPDDGLMFEDDAGPFLSLRAREDDPRTRRARETHKVRMESEHWRLLYVAMTRARDRLIVCGAQRGNAREGEDQKSWRLAVETAMRTLGAEPCETPFGAGLRVGQIASAQADAQPSSASMDLPSWARTSVESAAPMRAATPSRIGRIDPALFSPRGDGQRRFRRGRIIHQLLERLPDIAAERRSAAALTWLKRQGVGEDDARVFAQEALNVLGDARFASVFGPLSRAEAPIVGEAAGRPVRGVVDRLVVETNRIVILDFKTDRPAPIDPALAPAQYVLQLALYREVLSQIFPGRTVSCALLWTEAPHLMDLPESRLTDVLEAFARG
jgi:ATP-dependent helicase/nuclease subunit A